MILNMSNEARQYLEMEASLKILWDIFKMYILPFMNYSNTRDRSSGRQQGETMNCVTRISNQIQFMFLEVRHVIKKYKTEFN